MKGTDRVIFFSTLAGSLRSASSDAKRLRRLISSTRVSTASAPVLAPLYGSCDQPRHPPHVSGSECHDLWSCYRSLLEWIDATLMKAREEVVGSTSLLSGMQSTSSNL